MDVPKLRLSPAAMLAALFEIFESKLTVNKNLLMANYANISAGMTNQNADIVELVTIKSASGKHFGVDAGTFLSARAKQMAGTSSALPNESGCLLRSAAQWLI
ncbi:hypothetical protein ACJJTC_019504 [Scirpophaga incertulas]